MNKIEIALSRDFLSSLDNLPKRYLSKVNELIEKFKRDPTINSLNFEKLKYSSSHIHYSLRVDEDYRCILVKPDDKYLFIFLFIAKHDEAYNWAKKYRCLINAITGSVQIINVVEPPLETYNKLNNDNFIYKHISDNDLLRLGLPENLLGHVRMITSEDQLDAMKDLLPEEAYEGLFYLLVGDDINNVLDYLANNSAGKNIDTNDYSSALLNANSQRRFYIVDKSDIDLMSMLHAPLEKWRVFLHPMQRNIATKDWNGPVRVLGGAGTGKTVVALHRAKELASKLTTTQKRILFTTYTTNLTIDIKENLKRICDESTLNKIEVINLDAWVNNFLNRQKINKRIVYDKELNKIWEDIYESIENEKIIKKIDQEFLKSEWEKVIQPNLINSLHDYISVSRVGRGISLKGDEKKIIWDLFIKYKKAIEEKNIIDIGSAYNIARMMLNNSKNDVYKYSSIIVDEAQDLSAPAFALIRSLVNEGPNDIFIVGDCHQRIYGYPVTLNKCGINIRGRGKKLKLNYRTTDEVRKWAVKLITNEQIDDLDQNIDNNIGYKSLYHGPEPIIKKVATIEDQVIEIANYYNQIKNENNKEILCLVLHNKELIYEYKKLLKYNSIETVEIKKDSSDMGQDNKLRIATMHRVKGLNFDHVIIAGIKRDMFGNYNNHKDQTSNKLQALKNKSLIYVAATRTKKTLLLLGPDAMDIYHI